MDIKLSAPGTAITPTIAWNKQPSPMREDEILDWEIPIIDTLFPSDTVRVRVRDVEPEPLLDI